MSSVVTIDHLTVRFGRKVAVDDLSLEVPAGKVYGFLGENGAGKTTTIRAMMGLQIPTSGTIRVLGEDPLQATAALRQHIGFVSDDRAMYRWMTVAEVQQYGAGLFEKWDMPYAEQIREEFELEPDKKVKQLSRGQAAKVALLCALAPHPELLILDEASSGLDPIVRRALLEKLIDVSSREGTTIFLSSHLIEEIDRVAELVAILCRGRLLVEGNKDQIRRSLKRLVYPSSVTLPPMANGILSMKHANGECQLVVRDLDEAHLKKLTQSLGVTPTISEMTLEDVFAEYTACGKCRVGLAPSVTDGTKE